MCSLSLSVSFAGIGNSWKRRASSKVRSINPAGTSCPVSTKNPVVVSAWCTSRPARSSAPGRPTSASATSMTGIVALISAPVSGRRGGASVETADLLQIDLRLVVVGLVFYRALPIGIGLFGDLGRIPAAVLVQDQNLRPGFAL